jgi:hypothetical protein
MPKKLCQTITIMEYITTFEQLAICTEGQFDLFFKECFISGLKDAIKAHVMMQHPQTWLEACDRAKEVEIVINAQIKRHLFNTHPNPPMETTHPIQLTASLHPQVISRRDGRMSTPPSFL